MIKDAIFYIKYYAKKHDMVIERKATLLRVDIKNSAIHTKSILMYGQLKK
jgi:hypothetical protein